MSALCNRFPEAKNTLRWIKEGWHVAVAYVIGVTIYMTVIGWKPYNLQQHPTHPIVNPTIGGGIAAGVTMLALYVAVRHWLTARHRVARPLLVPAVGPSSRSARRSTAVAGPPAASGRLGSPRQRRTLVRLHLRHD